MNNHSLIDSVSEHVAHSRGDYYQILLLHQNHSDSESDVPGTYFNLLSFVSPKSVNVHLPQVNVAIFSDEEVL